MAKREVTVNGKVTIVDFAKPRRGGTLLMPSKPHRKATDYRRKPKHRYQGD